MIEIFTGPGCGYCEKAKALLQEKGMAFAERDIAEAGSLEELRRRLPRSRSIPQVFVAGAHIGGYEDLVHLDRTGKLAALAGQAEG